MWLQRLYDNIFQNTVKHSKAEKLVVTIENEAVTVRDSGIGFDVDSRSLGLGLKKIRILLEYLVWNMPFYQMKMALFLFYSNAIKFHC
ncbi:ATP-binding protein [Siminovitchia fortis]|uniref:ATP-binding protein n=1 Tax=Siminovitchia fortis TaxID=254758 RepID=UPI001F3ABFC6|nr:ATP-binding protein [Siminovitchia fortis]WHY82552.1 ATP-binding protein [Siminovitchia fortis]